MAYIEIPERTKSEYMDYVNKTWEVLRDLHACDDLQKSDFHFIDSDEDDYVVIGVYHNGDNSCWYEVYFFAGSVAKVAQYDDKGEMIGYIYDVLNDWKISRIRSAGNCKKCPLKKRRFQRALCVC